MIFSLFLIPAGCNKNSDNNSDISSNDSSDINDSSGKQPDSSVNNEDSSVDKDVDNDEKIKLNDNLYLALSTDINDERTSVLYNADGGPFRCDYVYIPDEDIRGEYNSVGFTLNIKYGGGYLFIAESESTDVPSLWGDSAAYSRVTVFGGDYFGKVGYFNDKEPFGYANSSVLKIKDGDKEVQGAPVDMSAGKTYNITYRLQKGSSLSFFYTRSVYDGNGGAFCWGGWNSGYCYDFTDSVELTDFYACTTEGKIIMEIKDTFSVNGHTATVLIPENFNGEWIWKTEFFYAFDKAERDLYNLSYGRVYYEISDKYGSPDAVNLMNDFYNEFIKRYPDMNKKCHLAGFSRGGLYAFNFAMKYPSRIKSMYLDAPVLDLRSWPRTDPKYNEVYLHEQVMAEYGFKSEEEFLSYKLYPVEQLKEYFALGIPTLLIAGMQDTTVAFSENSQKMIDYCVNDNIALTFYAKLDADHHPHSFGNLGGPDMYGRPYPERFRVYSSEFAGSSYDNPVEIESDTKYIIDFYNKLG